MDSLPKNGAAFSSTSTFPNHHWPPALSGVTSQSRRCRCIICSQFHDSLFKICDECRAKRNKKRRDRKLLGICRNCSNPVEPGYVNCLKCITKYNA
jgi:predicted amidophosphoribosyltransferase